MNWVLWVSHVLITTIVIGELAVLPGLPPRWFAWPLLFLGVMWWEYVGVLAWLWHQSWDPMEGDDG